MFVKCAVLKMLNEIGWNVQQLKNVSVDNSVFSLLFCI